MSSVASHNFQKKDLAGVILRPTFWREQLDFLKIIFKIFKIIFQLENTQQKDPFFKINLPKLNPNVGIISFFQI
jgi:hypothetical protein